MLRRVLAWIALLFFIFIVVNILFIHVYVTESATIFLIYTLIFMFGTKGKLFGANSMQKLDSENSDEEKTPGSHGNEEEKTPGSHGNEEDNSPGDQGNEENGNQGTQGNEES